MNNSNNPRLKSSLNIESLLSKPPFGYSLVVGQKEGENIKRSVSVLKYEAWELTEDFVKVAESNEIAPSSMKAVDIAGERVCIINIEGNYYAIGNVCTHMGGPLDEGTLEGFDVECPWHGSKFDVRTGQPTKPPAKQPVLSYEVKVQNDGILVRKRK